MTTLSLGLDRTRLEVTMYVREKEAVFFSFLLPILLLALFSMIFDSGFTATDQARGMTAARWFLPGMVAAGVILTSFQTMAMSVATERDDGTLKRLRATPMPASAYFLGKVGLVATTSLLQVAALLVVARLGFDVPFPANAGRWGVFALVFLLGAFAGTVLGVAFSSLASARSIGAVVIGPLLVLQFISGVYVSFGDIPDWLKQVAAIFPLKWIAQGMRAAFYPDGLATLEMAGSWEVGRTALVLAAWSIGGLILCVRTFRWYKRGTV
ncbi:MAG: ABC transporter permease [Dermatophilaceae bacterium]